MAVAATARIEMDMVGSGRFDPTLFDPVLFDTVGWTDVLDGGDVRAQMPIVCEYGIKGSTPNDRIASTGTLSYALNNDSKNSGRLLGYYSPMHANKRAGFDYNVPVRFQLSDGVNTSYKFRGRLSAIDVTPGIHADNIVACEAVDWMDEAARLDLPDLAAQLNQRGDQLVTTILDALAAADQPTARSIETGLETYSIALDGGTTLARPKVREVLNQIAMSGLDYGYIKGDQTQGGTFMWENRHHRAANPTVMVTLTQNEIDGGSGSLVVPSSRDDIYSVVQVFVRPSRVDAAATTVLYSLQTVSAVVQAGASITIFGPYRDPVTSDQIGGTATVDPAATTDYLMNAAADGSGTNLTANFTVVASRTGIGVSFLITNTGATAGYVTMLQVRGKGIYRYSAMIEAVVPGAYGTQIMDVEMPLQNNVNVASDVATYLSQILAVSGAWVQAVRFLATQSATLLAAAILREPGDRIALSETVTGINTQFTINSVRIEYHASGDVWCTWGLELANMQRYWLLGTVGASELGGSTYLGF